MIGDYLVQGIYSIGFRKGFEIVWGKVWVDLLKVVGIKMEFIVPLYIKLEDQHPEIKAHQVNRTQNIRKEYGRTIHIFKK